MAMFSAIWITGTIIWYLLSQQTHCAALRNLGNLHLEHADNLALFGGAGLLFVLFIIGSRELARGSLGLQLLIAAAGIALSFVAMFALSLLAPLCEQTLA